MEYDVNTLRMIVGTDAGMKACLCQIKDAIKAEGYKGKSYFLREECLNVDNWEKLLHRANRYQTVDFAVGLKQGIILLLEAKFRADTPNNFARNLKDKIYHSKTLFIGKDGFTRYWNRVIILVSDNSYQETKNRLKKLVASNPAIDVFRVSDLYNRFFV